MAQNGSICVKGENEYENGQISPKQSWVNILIFQTVCNIFILPNIFGYSFVTNIFGYSFIQKIIFVPH